MSSYADGRMLHRCSRGARVSELVRQAETHAPEPAVVRRYLIEDVVAPPDTRFVAPELVPGQRLAHEIAGLRTTPVPAAGLRRQAFHPTVSSRRDAPPNRREMGAGCSSARGSAAPAEELSRLGRSLGQIMTILDAFRQGPGSPAFVALQENIRVEGRRDIQTKS